MDVCCGRLLCLLCRTRSVVLKLNDDEGHQVDKHKHAGRAQVGGATLAVVDAKVAEPEVRS